MLFQEVEETNLLSSNNVIYGCHVAYEEKRPEIVIDSNAKLMEIMEREERAQREKFLEEERARRLAELEAAGESIPEGMDPDEFLGLADSIMGEAEPEPVIDVDYVAEAQAEAERILAEANMQAEEIMNAAQVNAEALKNIARQEGEKEGYNEGTQRAAIELQDMQQQLQYEVDQIKQEYLERSTNLEHEIVEMCLGVFEKVFNAELSGRKDVIYHLLDHCIMKIERTKQMQIKVNEANAEFIRSKKEELQAKVGSDVVFDIIADPYLDDSQCIIETDGGVFDCSINTELDGLIRAIRALS